MEGESGRGEEVRERKGRNKGKEIIEGNRRGNKTKGKKRRRRKLSVYGMINKWAKRT